MSTQAAALKHSVTISSTDINGRARTNERFTYVMRSGYLGESHSFSLVLAKRGLFSINGIEV